MKLSERILELRIQNVPDGDDWFGCALSEIMDIIDEAAQLEDNYEEIDGYLSYERSQVDKLKLENERLRANLKATNNFVVDALKEGECSWCDGTGEVDSGGVTPQGHSINIACQCQGDALKEGG